MTGVTRPSDDELLEGLDVGWRPTSASSEKKKIINALNRMKTYHRPR